MYVEQNLERNNRALCNDKARMNNPEDENSPQDLVEYLTTNS